MVKDEKGNEFFITSDVASAIHFDLIVNGYINKVGESDTEYYQDKKNGEVKVADEVKEYASDVIGIIDSIYDSKSMAPVNARSNNVELQVRQEKLNSKEFKALWSRSLIPSLFMWLILIRVAD